MIIYKALPIRVIPDGSEAIPEVQYCRNAVDFENMGLACIAMYDEGQTRVFLDDNFDVFAEYIQNSHVLGFGSQLLDDELLRMHGIPVKSIDLLTEIDRALGDREQTIEELAYTHTLNAMARANGIPSQQMEFGRLSVCWQTYDRGTAINGVIEAVGQIGGLWERVSAEGVLNTPSGGVPVMFEASEVVPKGVPDHGTAERSSKKLPESAPWSLGDRRHEDRRVRARTENVAPTPPVDAYDDGSPFNQQAVRPVRGRPGDPERNRGPRRDDRRDGGGRRERRPSRDENVGVRGSGVVRFYNENKGYGFIEQDDPNGDDLFAHATELRGTEYLEPDDRVTFYIGQGPKGLVAKAIELDNG